MKGSEIDICCKYGFAVNLLIENIEDLIEDVYNGCDIEEVEREIDWAKVPRMTKVQVRDSKERMWTNSYFVGYSGYKEGYYPYLATVCIDDEFTGIKRRGMAYKFCRIHPDVEIPEEWYK